MRVTLYLLSMRALGTLLSLHQTFVPRLLLSYSLDLLQMGFQLSPAPSQQDSTALGADDGNTLVVTILEG